MAVYTKLARADMTKISETWSLGKLQAFGGIADGIENTTYWITTTQGKFIISIYEQRVQQTDLPFFLGLMNHLAHKGIPCPRPHMDGTSFGTIKGKPMAVVGFLEGRSVHNPTPAHCRALGDMLGRLHIAQTDFKATRQNMLTLPHWIEIAHTLNGKNPSIPQNAIIEQLNKLKAQWPKPTALPTGIIHADLFPDNVFFIRDIVSGVVDFYFACNDFMAYDLTIALNAWAFAPDGTYLADNASDLLLAYQQHRKLSPQEIDALPTLAMGAAMRFLLTRLQAIASYPHNKNPYSKNPMEYFTKLQFHATNPTAFCDLVS